MPQKTKTSKKKLFLITAAVVLLLGGGTAAYMVYKNAQDTNKPRGMNDVDYSPATPSEKQEGEQHKTTDTTPTTTPTTDQKPGTPPENQAPSTQTQTITAVITRANQSGSTVSVRASIEGATSGTCEITFTKSGQASVTKTFPVSFEATTSQCQGADIPSSSFPAAGTWNVALKVTNGSQTSNTVTGSVDVTK